jgi:hypothetical protein
MGLIGRALSGGAIASVGEAAEDLSEVFVANATREMELSQEAYAMALEAAMEEFRQPGQVFDRFVNGLNRLPRPFMALGTIGLFVFAMGSLRPSRRAWWGWRRCRSRSGGCWARSWGSISARGNCTTAACRALRRARRGDGSWTSSGGPAATRTTRRWRIGRPVIAPRGEMVRVR